jgi:hypothetical protein
MGEDNPLFLEPNFDQYYKDIIKVHSKKNMNFKIRNLEHTIELYALDKMRDASGGSIIKVIFSKNTLDSLRKIYSKI